MSGHFVIEKRGLGNKQCCRTRVYDCKVEGSFENGVTLSVRSVKPDGTLMADVAIQVGNDAVARKVTYNLVTVGYVDWHGCKVPREILSDIIDKLRDHTDSCDEKEKITHMEYSMHREIERY